MTDDRFKVCWIQHAIVYETWYFEYYDRDSLINSKFDYALMRSCWVSRKHSYKINGNTKIVRMPYSSVKMLANPRIVLILFWSMGLASFFRFVYTQFGHDWDFQSNVLIITNINLVPFQNEINCQYIFIISWITGMKSSMPKRWKREQQFF